MRVRAPGRQTSGQQRPDGSRKPQIAYEADLCPNAQTDHRDPAPFAGLRLAAPGDEYKRPVGRHGQVICMFDPPAAPSKSTIRPGGEPSMTQDEGTVASLGSGKPQEETGAQKDERRTDAHGAPPSEHGGRRVHLARYIRPPQVTPGSRLAAAR